MTKEQALDMIRAYAIIGKILNLDPEISEIDQRWPADGSKDKAMRWLGFCQGYLVAKGAVTLDQAKRDTASVIEGGHA